jgi:hypothetical protein
MTNVNRCSCKVHFILVRFYCNLNILYIFSKSIRIPHFIKIRPVAAELFHVDGQTDRHDEATRNFANAPNDEPTGRNSSLQKRFLLLYTVFF